MATNGEDKVVIQAAGADHQKLSSSLPEEKKKARSLASKQSVKSELLVKAFQAEIDVMDKEDNIKLLKKEHEHLMKMEKAQMELKRLKLQQEHAKKIAELEKEEGEEFASSISFELPEETNQESVERFFKSQPSEEVKVESQEVPVIRDLPPSRTSTDMGLVAESLAQVANLMVQQNATNQQVLASSQLPKVDVPVFNGDPLRYPIWRNAFSSFIDAQPLTAATKLNMLNTCVSGEPKKVVEHYLLLGTDEAYMKARETLANRYGNPSVVSSAFMKKLSSWPKISDRDPGGLQSFADFLQQVSVAKMSVNSLGILDFPQENVKLLKKLPFYLERKWREEIGRWKRASHGTYPTFTRFVDFVNSAGETANIPELEGIRVEEPRVKPSSPRAKAFQGRTLSTTAEKGKDYSSCPFCSEAHHVDDCTGFDKMPYRDRKMFFFKKFLCMGCGTSSQHLVKNCKQRRRCKKCQQKHLTCLHREQAERGTSNCTTICALPDQDGKDHCMIVPVWVRHIDDPGRESLEYAILDDQSNVGFVSESLCSTLGVNGPETELMLTTMHQSTRVSCQKISGLEVLDYKKSTVIKLPPSFSRHEVPAKRSQIPKADVVKKWKHLAPIATELMPYDSSIKVSLLIGNNCPRAIRPREVLPGGEDDPYGMKTSLGWGVVGRVCQSSQPDDGAVYHRIQTSPGYPHFVVSQKAKEVFNPERIIQILEKDFIEGSEKGEPYSVDETKFINILEEGIVRKPDGHYEMPLPLRSGQAVLPDNKPMAMKRWNQLTARFRRNPRFQEDYVAFMEDVITNHAEKVTAEQLIIKGRINYIPHSGVYHPRKPEKIRVVFDCSASYQGVSLNDHLLQGPNLMNSLIRVLHRFRKEEVAFATDVKSMFHQFGVSTKDRDLLRFMWYEDNDVNKEAVEYRMKVHLFGAVSSPGCANFGLKRVAADGEDEHGSDAADFIRNDFYVDDGLSSRPTPGEAVKVLQDSKAICAKAGLKLHKIVSNSREVLKSFPVEERAKCIQELNLDVDPLALERALGVTWSTEEDTFQFHVQLEERPLNRRGVLSTIGTIYDPSGFVGPALLKGKRILQEMCRSKLDWDTPMPGELQTQWNAWQSDIRYLQDIRIPRCYKPKSFGKVKAVELHHFSDASQEGYGQCSYIRLINENNTAHCSLVSGKSRVAPLKQVTIPRLELAAATVSARMSAFLRSELKYPVLKEFFWTDSKVVLGYIKNEARRFHVYVANRVQLIRNLTDQNAWYYVDTTQNPADEASRGISAKDLTKESRWLVGPEFLWTDGVFQAKSEEGLGLSDDDPEVKRVTTFLCEASNHQGHLETSRLKSFSNWHQAKKAVAKCQRFVDGLKERVRRAQATADGNGNASSISLAEPSTVEDLQRAERAIIKGLQAEYFPVELEVLRKLNTTGEVTSRQVTAKRNSDLKKTSGLYRLDPYLDEYGIIRVGGRIDRANISSQIRHPVILPQKSHVSNMVIRYYHELTQHMGRSITHNELRQRGYWVIGGSSAVSLLISQCVTCRKLRGPLVQQKMSELPKERVEPSAPFTYSAVDYFGPFLIKERRSEVKRYGVLFTCMSSRSVHLETANSLSSSAFINALRRFMSRRGTVRQLRSDQGTTFVGARNELKEALSELDQGKVQEYLLENGCEWIPFEMNVPHSSHMGGVWERQIQTVRRALDTVLAKVGSQPDDEAFRTFMIEAECIVNSRPLRTVNLSDAEAPEPLCPLQLLTMKPKVILPPPGNFKEEDKYARKWWRRVQYLANEFWLRWRREYLQQLQTRQKWTRPQRDLVVGDVVIVKETDDVRLKWPIAKVVEVFPSQDGRVRKVKILMADGTLDNRGKRVRKPSYLDRPVQKLVLLLSAESQE